MYEPIISPWLFYLSGLLPCLSMFLFLVSAMAFLFGLVNFLIKNNESEKNTYSRCLDRIESANKWCKIWFVLGISCAVLNVIIPNERTFTKMVIASQVTPHNIEMVGETAENIIDTIGEKIDKVADKATDKVVRVVQEVKK